MGVKKTNPKGWFFSGSLDVLWIFNDPELCFKNTVVLINPLRKENTGLKVLMFYTGCFKGSSEGSIEEPFKCILLRGYCLC